MDAARLRRLALVVPGGLLLAYGLAGVAFFEFVHGESQACGDGGLVDWRDACYRGWALMLPPVLGGLVLLMVGNLTGAKPDRTVEALLLPGPATVFLGWLLGTLFLGAWALAAWARSQGGADGGPMTLVGDAEYPVSQVAAALTVVALLPLATYLVLMSEQATRRKRLLKVAQETVEVAPGAAPEARIEPKPTRSVTGEQGAVVFTEDDNPFK